MRKKIRIGVMALVVVAVCGIIWFSLPPKEPVYRGKPLRYWLSAYDLFGQADFASYVRRNKEDVVRPTQAEATEALHATGKDAIPILLEMLNLHDSRLKMVVRSFLDRQRFVKFNWKDRNPEVEARTAMCAFQVLGPQRDDLIPQFTRIYKINPAPQARQNVIMIAAYVAPDRETIVPLLLRALRETNDYVLRNNAVVALGKTRLRPDLAVPALIGALSDPDPLVQGAAVVSLGKYGAQARAAIPALRKLRDEAVARAAKGEDTASLESWGFYSGNAQPRYSSSSYPGKGMSDIANETLRKIDVDGVGMK